MKNSTFLASFGFLGLRLVELFGVDSQSFLKQLGYSSTVVLNGNCRVTTDVADRGFSLAMKLIPDPAFALRVAECWHPSDFGTLGYAWLSSGSLRTALKRMERFIKIVTERAVLTCSDSSVGLKLTLETGRGDTPLSHTMADFGLALIIALCRTNFGSSLKSCEVGLKRSAPTDYRRYEEFFGCPVAFGSQENYFVLPSDVVEFPLPTSNLELAQIFDDILVAALDALQGDDLEKRCKRYLLEELTSGEPDEDSLARALAMSRRTLQRKLRESGLTYRTVLETTRYELA